MLRTGIDHRRSRSYLTTMNERGEVTAQKELLSSGEIAGFLNELKTRKAGEPASSPAQGHFCANYVTIV